jgi:hypothetical protein
VQLFHHKLIPLSTDEHNSDARAVPWKWCPQTLIQQQYDFDHFMAISVSDAAAACAQADCCLPSRLHATLPPWWACPKGLCMQHCECICGAHPVGHAERVEPIFGYCLQDGASAVEHAASSTSSDSTTTELGSQLLLQRPTLSKCMRQDDRYGDMCCSLDAANGGCP